MRCRGERRRPLVHDFLAVHPGDHVVRWVATTQRSLMNNNGYNKWVMLGHIVSGSREQGQTPRSVPMLRFRIRESGEGREWNAVAFGNSCEFVEQETEDGIAYIFEGKPKQHTDGSSKLQVPEFFMQVLYVRSVMVPA